MRFPRLSIERGTNTQRNDHRERGGKQSSASPFAEYEYQPSKQRVAAILLTERDGNVKRYFIKELSQGLPASKQLFSAAHCECVLLLSVAHSVQ